MYARSLLFIALLSLAAALPAPWPPGASSPSARAGSRSVQFVYESDTRGYYLPCG